MVQDTGIDSEKDGQEVPCALSNDDTADDLWSPLITPNHSILCIFQHHSYLRNVTRVLTFGQLIDPERGVASVT